MKNKPRYIFFDNVPSAAKLLLDFGVCDTNLIQNCDNTRHVYVLCGHDWKLMKSCDKNIHYWFNMNTDDGKDKFKKMWRAAVLSGYKRGFLKRSGNDVFIEGNRMIVG